MAQSPRRSSSHGKMKILRKLGSGKTGTVYVVRINNVERALKVFIDRRHFWREYWAYRKCTKIESLKGRIPSFEGVLQDLPAALAHKHCFYHRSLLLDILTGETLDKVIDSLPPDQLQPLRDDLLDTMRIMQDEAGVCHGDPGAWNIMVLSDKGKGNMCRGSRIVCFDFSHALLREQTSERIWDIRTTRDKTMLNSIFSESSSRRAKNMTIQLATPAITNDPYQQLKLARFITKAFPSSDLFKALESIESPIPVLAISIARAMDRGGQTSSALAMLEAYSPPKLHIAHEWSDRDILELEFERANLRARTSSSHDGVKLMAPIAAKFAELLGSIDHETLRVTLAYAKSLRKNNQIEDAAKVYLHMLDNLNCMADKSANSNRDTMEHRPSDTVAWTKQLDQDLQEIFPYVVDQEIQLRILVILKGVGGRKSTQCLAQQITP